MERKKFILGGGITGGICFLYNPDHYIIMKSDGQDVIKAAPRIVTGKQCNEPTIK